MQDAKEEVRARLNIEDVIGEYVQLKRAGRSFKGLSPFSGERTPSFFVSPDKQIWHDFSSNKGGDVFSFVMEVEGMDFRQALELLARKAGVELSQYDSKRSGEIARKKQRLLEAHRYAANYYQRTMLSNQHAMEYIFQKRGLNRQTVSDFQIGYAPDSKGALIQFLLKKGFTRQELSEAGLTNRFGGDMFRARTMVPLMDPSGQVIGFTARIIQDVPDAPKYLNTSQTFIYDKGRHVFGLSQAKEAIRNTGYVVAVEGNMDVISSHQAGVKQVVATAGTAMTEHHLSALKRLTADVRLAFDGDKAGIAATERAIGIASNLGVELTIISLPDGAKDPDELIQQDVAKWQRAIDEAMPAVDWILDQYSNREDLSTASGKRTFTTASLAIVRQLADPVEREHYENKIAKMTNSSLATVHTKLTQLAEAKEDKVQKPVADSAKTINKDDYSYQDNALALGVLDISSRELMKNLPAEYFVGEQRQKVAEYLGGNLERAITDTPEDLKTYDTYVKILLLRADTRYAEWEERERYFEMARLVRQIETEHKKQKLQNLTEKLREAEDLHDEVLADTLRSDINQLIKEIARAKK